MGVGGGRGSMPPEYLVNILYKVLRRCPYLKSLLEEGKGGGGEEGSCKQQ